MIKDIEKINKITDEELANTAGGYVVINDVGCYELYDDEGKYQGTFRGDQLGQLKKYAKKHGISDEIVSNIDPEQKKSTLI